MSHKYKSKPAVKKHDSVPASKKPDSESEDDAPDFDKLLKLPPSTGSHFMLKSEEKKFQELQEANMFSIDIKLLNLAMQSIPFNERYDVKTVEWTSGELEKMKQEAQAAEGKYQEALLNNPGKVPKAAEKPPEASIQKPKEKTPSKPKTEKESMQNWLDDILDL